MATSSVQFLKQSGEYEQAEGPTIKVRALKEGDYEYLLRREGDVFTLKPRMITVYNIQGGRPEIDPATGKPLMRLSTAEEQFSNRWMERVDEDEPERTTTSTQALQQATDDIASAKGLRPAHRRKE